MTARWIVEHADGALTQHEDKPGTAGIPMGIRRMQISREADLSHERPNWSTGTMEPRLNVWRAELLAAVDDARENARRPYMTQLLEQSFVYASKGREADTYRSLAVNVLSALTVIQRRQRFPLAMAEVDETGDLLATVIGRFQAGQDASNAAIGRIEARATRAKKLIRAATNLDAMQAAAAVNWEN